MMSDDSNNSNSNTTNASNTSGQDIELLRSIDSTLKSILKQGASMSQADARNAMPGRQYGQPTSQGNSKRADRNGLRGKTDGTDFKGVMNEFNEGLREQLFGALFGEDIKGSIRKTLHAFEEEFDISFRDIPKEVGKRSMKFVVDEFKKTEAGQKTTKALSQAKDKAMSTVKSGFKKGVADYDKANGTDFSEKLRNVANKAQQTIQGANPNDKEAKVATGLSKMSSDVQSGSTLDLILQHVEAIDMMMSSDHGIVNVNPETGELFDGMDGLMDIRQKMSDTITSELKDKALSAAKDKAAEAGLQGGLENLASKEGLNALLAGLKGGATELIGSFSGMAATIAPLLPYIAAAGAALFVAKKVVEAFGDTVEATKNLIKKASESANRSTTSRKKNLELAEKRILEDTETLVKEPFEILKNAAQEWYDVWDSQLRTISGTQGYSKDDLYELMGNYAERLRSEGLTSVVSSSDITSNLAKVLESGLSGQVAEEFAYIATKLNAAIPTQDFFNYAETYASLAANAIKNGASQTEAINYANEQLEAFANNVLYASRELSGGFSTGLKDAQSLFQSSVEIATASKTGNATTISGVLTSVAAIVGAIAPDLSTSIVDAVVNAAVGGNSEEIVALRSLAGINASNTEFLKALANDPQSVFVELFQNLGKMQNMSEDAYMEVAEGVASIFGLQKEALQRVDFEYLAEAIGKMSTTTNSLDENVALLASGESTTTAEQLKMAQINEYMIEEGLEYVLDNAAARSIQEHMWDEQLARELMEASYAVELQGSALDFLEGLQSTVEKISSILNPLAWAKKVANLVVTAEEGVAQRADLAQFLQLGAVGSGSAKTFYQLTTTGVDLGLTKSLVSQMGGFSAYDALDTSLSVFNNLMGFASGTTMFDSLRNSANQSSLIFLNVIDKMMSSNKASSTNIGSSRYNWGMVGKTTASYVSGLPGVTSLSTSALTTSPTTTSASTANSNSRIENFINTVEDFASSGQGYDAWRETAYKYGITDFDQALEDYGLTEGELKDYFNQYEALAAAQAEHELEEEERQFRQAGINFWEVTHPTWEDVINNYFEESIANQEEQTLMMADYFKIMSDNQTTQIELQQYGNKVLDKLYSTEAQFYNQWVEYYVNHTAYKSAFSSYDVNVIKQAEQKSGQDAVLALANALTGNVKELSDPAVQSNVLLSQILIVVEAIMQQNNNVGGVLPTALASLGLGITNT